MLERTRVRKQIAEILSNKEIFAEIKQIRDTPFRNVKEADCPCINIFTLNESGNLMDKNGPISFNTNLTINLEIIITEKENYSTEIDNLCEKIENALLKNPIFTKEFSSINEYSTQIAIEAEGERPLVKAIITLVVEYDNEFAEIVENEDNTDIKIDVDLISPINDKNLSELGPDTRIEGQI